MWSLSRYSHTGQRQVSGRIKGRIHDCTRHALHNPKPRLRQRGCPYMVHESGTAHNAIFDAGCYASVSNSETAIHIIDETGATVRRGKRASDPQVQTTTLRRLAPDLVRVGLETGPLTPWLYHTCKGSRPSHRMPGRATCSCRYSLTVEQTDARDAETLAQLVRTGWYREARVKSFAAHAVRHLVGARVQLMGVSIDLSNQIRSTLKTFGLMAGKGLGRTFENRGCELIDARPTIAAIVEPLLAARRVARDQVLVLDRRLVALPGRTQRAVCS